MDDLLRFDNLIQALRQYQQAVVEEYRDKIIIDGHIASGSLINDIECPAVEIEGNIYSVYIRVKPYFDYVEKGVNGTEKDQGSPYSFNKHKRTIPPNVVLEWIKVKHILPRPDRNGHIPSQRSLAYIIAKSIHEKGLEPGNELKRTLEELNGEWTTKILQALTKDLSESIGLIMREKLKPEDTIYLFSKGN